jgi:hypothetical protein
LTNWRFQVQTHVTRAVTRMLRAFGLRDAVVRWRSERARARREAAEARGQDHLSRPALHQLDMKLNAIIDRDAGFFVEAGANNGYTQSNTYWLERFRGWRGLLVEPMPELAAEARLARPGASVFQCALTEDDAQVLRMHFGDLMSMVDGARAPGWTDFGNLLGWRDPYELDVDGRTLSSLLEEIDLERHAPRFILVEIHDRERDRPPVEAVLDERYLAHSWLSPTDLLYVRRDEAQNGHARQADRDSRPRSWAKSLG